MEEAVLIHGFNNGKSFYLYGTIYKNRNILLVNIGGEHGEKSNA